jgi:hypothetical protein
MDIFANVESHQGRGGKWWRHGLFPSINMSEHLLSYWGIHFKA